MKKSRLAIITMAIALGIVGVTALPAAASNAHVTVPSNYVYNPDGPHKTLHDYCSYSPDSYGSANFRGPCARHDMCIQYAQKARSGCDSDLFSNMKQECRYAYGFPYVTRGKCYAVAATYYAVVSVKTHL